MDAAIKTNGSETSNAKGPLVLPHPTDKSRLAAWNGTAFDLGDRLARVLAYDVAASGWTDELTRLHEETGGSDHFIDVASRIHAMEEVVRCTTARRSTILEIGCSSGFLLRDLIARLPGHRVVGSDYTRGTLESVGRRLPNVPLIQFDLTRCPLPDCFADVVILLNVLEHIDDHEAAAAQLFRIMRPGGATIIEVPAGASLYDIYDRVLMHHRRYDLPDLIRLLERSGFIIERRSHLGFFLFPGFYLSKRLNQVRYPAGAYIDEQTIVSKMIVATRKRSRVLGLVLAVERMLRRYIPYPRGIRCLVTCRKPGAASGAA